ncbi:MAG: OstA-like protein [Mucilaginibacter sp.]
MFKYLLTFLLLIAVSAVTAQQKSVIHLIKSESIQGVKINGVDVLKVYKGTFQQDFSTLQSDSAYFHQKENTFDAFGHVVITQGDTMHIYSDKLNYNGNTKIAILTDNVRMVDKDATLTTNYLTYNTATRIGTYTGGGKLVNKQNTLTSKNGYYFAHSRDSYFRYDVVLLTEDAIIKTDTLRYNTGSRIAYFYGPTNIYGKKKGKDNDTLYTENGLYNTQTEQAFFGKKNQYRQGTKTLHGDSLFYDRKKGYGRAIDHVTFNDTEQKITLKGDLGTYYKSDERTVMTKNAYGIMVTEEKDTTNSDSVKAKNDSLGAKGKKTKKDKESVKQADNKTQVASPDNKKNNPPPHTMVLNKLPIAKKETDTKRDTTTNKKKQPDSLLAKKDTGRIKHDSIYMTADTLETRILPYKELKELQEKIRLSHIKDTSAKPPSIVYKGVVKHIDLEPPRMPKDTIFLHRGFFGKPKPKEEVAEVTDKKKKGKAAVKTQIAENPKKPVKSDTTKVAKATASDSVYMNRKIELSDTSRVRILSAFHHVKLFKSDLQGKSDSAFYSTSDSTMRLYVSPIIWTQGSQLTADTINLQMKNKKLDNMDLYPNAFVVNVEKKDSIHFNQVAGKKMRGFFRDGKLYRMFVDGNAETIYYSRDSLGKISGMQRSLSSRIGINFSDGKVTALIFMGKPEHRYGPLAKFTEDDKILKGFTWKPKERPVSKEAIISVFNKNVPAKNEKGKPPAKKEKGKATGAKKRKETAPAKGGSVAAPPAKAVTDSTQKALPNKLPDTVKKGKDTTSVKKAVAKPTP